LEPLTYGETEALVGRLATTAKKADRTKLLTVAHKNCTLLSKTRIDDKPTTWQLVCEKQKSTSRVP
jgi:hypothetical protein